jgi:uncharacterized membrane protein YeaQ/YmgE (transglycosylase-associated protein family)
MSLQAQVFIIIMVVGFVLGGIAALSDKGRGLVTYLVFGVVGSSVGGALLVPVLAAICSGSFQLQLQTPQLLICG